MLTHLGAHSPFKTECIRCGNIIRKDWAKETDKKMKKKRMRTFTCLNCGGRFRKTVNYLPPCPECGQIVEALE